jgi:single-strand DNA-binding protein
MSGETVINVVGNLTADPELKFTSSGAGVASFTVASTPRTFDRQSGEWKDGEALFLRCNVWRDPAENAAESLTRGMRVIGSIPAPAASSRSSLRAPAGRASAPAFDDEPPPF